MSFISVLPEHPLRRQLEHTVEQVFRKEFRATPAAFPQQMAAVLDSDGRPSAVTGLRFAADGFFSERYLDLPVEQAVSAALGLSIGRDQVVEFTSLASVRPGAAMPLVASIIRECLTKGYRCGLFTATDRLRALLRRAGLAVVDMVPATPDRIADPENWGSYYLHDPWVTAVSAEAVACLCDRHAEERRHA
ncbi:MAG: thermostable hemolysin [Magnetospirillum sp.]